MAEAQHTCAHRATSEGGTEPWDQVQLHAVPGIAESLAPGEVAVVSPEAATVSSEPRVESSEAVSSETVSSEAGLESQTVQLMLVAAAASVPGTVQELSGDEGLMIGDALRTVVVASEAWSVGFGCPSKHAAAFLYQLLPAASKQMELRPLLQKQSLAPTVRVCGLWSGCLWPAGAELLTQHDSC